MSDDNDIDADVRGVYSVLVRMREAERALVEIHKEVRRRGADCTHGPAQNRECILLYLSRNKAKGANG